jgi:hypothetical protein
MVLDDDEDEELRTLAVNALTWFGGVTGDDEVTGRISRLREETSSRPMKKAAAEYLTRHVG